MAAMKVLKRLHYRREDPVYSQNAENQNRSQSGLGVESFSLDARTPAGGEIQSDGYDSSKPTKVTDEPLE